MSNSLWQIAFGPYALIVDRRTLRFDLRDTKADIVWAESLPLGWIELQNEATGETSRHEFGDCKIISVSEKAGAQGKRILFGLDAPSGIPIDVYVICTEREIQLTVEASRDGKTHRVTGFGLVPELVFAPDDGASYLVRASEPAVGILARDAPAFAHSNGISSISEAGGMPFVGAVRAKNGASLADAPAGAIAVITDSLYACPSSCYEIDGGAHIDLEYERDPERRRLDVRIVVLPDENHVGIARAYRDKIIGEKNHVTLRRKIRERPDLDTLIGAAWIRSSNVPEPTQEMWGDNYRSVQTIALIDDFDDEVPPPPQTALNARATAVSVPDGYLEEKPNRWEAMDAAMATIEPARALGYTGIGLELAADWAFIATDFYEIFPASDRSSFLLPLLAVVYHDAVIFPTQFIIRPRRYFLYALLHLSPLSFSGTTYFDGTEWVPHDSDEAQRAEEYAQNIRIHAVLSPLHRLTFTAFLTEHRFLTPDALVEEAVYSDKTRIVINRSDANTYETPKLHLPPGGFWVRHTQMEAHDALRVSEQTFDTRAFRIRRALDNKPLEQSGDIETREFAV